MGESFLDRIELKPSSRGVALVLGGDAPRALAGKSP